MCWAENNALPLIPVLKKKKKNIVTPKKDLEINQYERCVIRVPPQINLSSVECRKAIQGLEFMSAMEPRMILLATEGARIPHAGSSSWPDPERGRRSRSSRQAKSALPEAVVFIARLTIISQGLVLITRLSVPPMGSNVSVHCFLLMKSGLLLGSH